MKTISQTVAINSSLWSKSNSHENFSKDLHIIRDNANAIYLYFQAQS